MIKSGKQYAASKKQLAMLEKSLAANMKNDVPKVIKEAGKKQLRELIDEIKCEIAEYERLRDFKLKDLKIRSVEDLMKMPIRYRIASHMSVDAFSRKVGINARQIHRYEAEEYSNANTNTFKIILERLDVNLNGRVDSKRKAKAA